MQIPLDKYLASSIMQAMTKREKPVTVAEAGRRGGKARAKKYPAEQLREWGRLGGWPKGRPRRPKKLEEKRGGKR
jgi:hypothetical protein